MSGIVDETYRFIAPHISPTESVLGLAAVSVAGIIASPFLLGASVVSNIVKEREIKKELEDDLLTIHYNSVLESEQAIRKHKQKMYDAIDECGVLSSEALESILKFSNDTDKFNDMFEKIYNFKDLMNKSVKLANDFDLKCDDSYINMINVYDSLYSNTTLNINDFYKLHDKFTKEFDSFVKKAKIILDQRQDEFKNLDYSQSFRKATFDKGKFIKLLLREDLEELLANHNKNDKLDFLSKTLNIRKEITEIYTKIVPIQSADTESFNQIVEQLKVVDEFLSNVDISAETNFHLLTMHQRVLKDEYQKMKAKNREYTKLIDELYTEIEINAKLKNALAIPLSKFYLENASNEMLQSIKQDNAVLNEMYHITKQNQQVHNIVRDIVQENNYEHLEDRSYYKNNNIYQKSFYHIEDGNVLTVVSSTDGTLVYEVNGSEFEGVAPKEDSVLKSMNNFCNVHKKIKNSIINNGHNIIESNIYEPDLDIVREKDFTGVLSNSKLNKLKQSKIQQSSSKKLLKRSV